jgi:hypothetical protein
MLVDLARALSQNIRYRLQADVSPEDEPVSDGKRRVMEKPTVKLIGEDGNVFNIIGLVRKALKRAGHPDLADEFSNKAMKQPSYDHVLALVTEYCEVE